MDTRVKSKLYLVGNYVTEIVGAKLPSYHQAFGYFLYLHKEKKKTVREASTQAVLEVLQLWTKASIPVRPFHHCVKKLETVFYEWKDLQKHKVRTTPGHKMKENAFLERADDLFDIAHMDALNMIVIPEDRAFLLSQREKGRPGSIGALDLNETNRRKRAAERAHSERSRKTRSDLEMAASATTISSQDILSSSTSSSEGEGDTNDNDDSCDDFDGGKKPACTSVHPPAAKRATSNVLSPGLLSALDRTQMSSRNATYVLSEMATSLGHDVSSLNVNTTSIQRARVFHRAVTSKKVKSGFLTSASLTVHWDGKLMEDLTGKVYVDRLPVIVSGLGVEQLLGVPKLSSGTGLAQAAAVMDCLNEWGVADKVVALCFDTTAANTGHRLGTCTILQQKLDRDLLFLACRHHTMELVVGSVFEETIGGSTGPDILLFKRFQQQWQQLDQKTFQSASTDTEVESLVAPYRNDIIAFAHEELSRSQPRDDYREFLELCLIFLEDRTGDEARFRSPGAMHRARWLAKVIYAVKLWLFRGQYKMTAVEGRGIRDLTVFAVLIYLKAWIEAPKVVEAPLNDFLLMKQLLAYPHPNISKAASKKLGLHLSYLSEELVGLGLFDSRVPVATKKLMLLAMDEMAPDHPSKTPRVVNSAFLNNRSLEQFCSSNSRRLFQLLKIPEAFLSLDPSDWEKDGSYAEALQIVKGLVVVNDRAERGVKLIQDFNKKLTKNEDQLQFLLQVVAEHRQQFPNCLKKTLVKNKV